MIIVLMVFHGAPTDFCSKVLSQCVLASNLISTLRDKPFSTVNFHILMWSGPASNLISTVRLYPRSFQKSFHNSSNSHFCTFNIWMVKMVRRPQTYQRKVILLKSLPTFAIEISFHNILKIVLISAPLISEWLQWLNLVGIWKKVGVREVNFAKSLGFSNWIRLMMSFISGLIYQESFLSLALRELGK